VPGRVEVAEGALILDGWMLLQQKNLLVEYG